MATNSIYKDIRIKDRKQCRKLIHALENATEKRGKNVTVSKMVQTVRGEDIKEMFSKKG